MMTQTKLNHTQGHRRCELIEKTRSLSLHWNVAQLVEPFADTEVVVGSSPTFPTMKKFLSLYGEEIRSIAA
jgi:hypothetical protein